MIEHQPGAVNLTLDTEGRVQWPSGAKGVGEDSLESHMRMVVSPWAGISSRRIRPRALAGTGGVLPRLRGSTRHACRHQYLAPHV